MARALLSLGSNLQPLRNLRAAATALRDAFPGARISDAWEFPAVGFEGPAFLNAGARVDTVLEPAALNDWLHALEDAHGRDRSAPRWSDRTLDIDIVYYDDRVISGTGHLCIPRPELRHAFVLMPLAMIAPDFVDPVRGQRLDALWAAHPDHGIARPQYRL